MNSSGSSVLPRPWTGAGRLVAIALLAVAVLLPASAIAARHRRAAAQNPSSRESGAGTEGGYTEACVLEPVSSTFILEKNDREPWPTASLAKMMVMLIVAQKLQDGSLKLSDRITASRAAARMGGSQVYLKEGETFSLEDMMKAIVVHSANDASLAVAEYIAGSAEGFVRLMNQKAAELGMKETHYYSVHGLPPAPGQQADVSSARDDALLARELVKYPKLLEWSGIDTAPFRNGAFVLRNTNHLVRTYKGCDGLKTGFYDKAGFNVVATAKRAGMRLIAVVLGSQHKLTNFKIAAELMSQGFLDYEMHPVAKRGAQIPHTVAVRDGVVPTLNPVFASDAAVFMKRGTNTKGTITVAYALPAQIVAPVKAGQQVGTAQVLDGGKPVTSVELVAPADVAREGSVIKRIFSKF